MKVRIEIVGLEVLSDLTGNKAFDFNFQGTNVKDLLEDLVHKYGEKVREVLYDGEGAFDPMIQIVLNGKDWVPAYRHENTLLHDGDTLSLVVLLAGG